MYRMFRLVCAVVVLGLTACGGGGGDVGQPPAANTIAITVELKDATHPEFGMGDMFGLVANGVQGGELMLQRGVTYTFQVNTPGHPVYFTTDQVGGAGFPARITTGVANDMIEAGVMTFTPDASLMAPVYYYQCGVHDRMGGRVILIP